MTSHGRAPAVSPGPSARGGRALARLAVCGDWSRGPTPQGSRADHSQQHETFATLTQESLHYHFYETKYRSWTHHPFTQTLRISGPHGTTLTAPRPPWLQLRERAPQRAVPAATVWAPRAGASSLCVERGLQTPPPREAPCVVHLTLMLNTKSGLKLTRRLGLVSAVELDSSSFPCVVRFGGLYSKIPHLVKCTSVPSEIRGYTCSSRCHTSRTFLSGENESEL